MEKEQLIENLLSLNVSEHQIDMLINKYELNFLIDHYKVIDFKKNILKETGIRNWAAFFYKNVTANANIDLTKRKMEEYYDKKKVFENKKQQVVDDEHKKKQERKQFLSDYDKMRDICSQLTTEERTKMNDRIDESIKKELGDLPSFGKDTLRSIKIIETFKYYSWDISIIKARLK